MTKHHGIRSCNCLCQHVIEVLTLIIINCQTHEAYNFQRFIVIEKYFNDIVLITCVDVQHLATVWLGSRVSKPNRLKFLKHESNQTTKPLYQNCLN